MEIVIILLGIIVIQMFVLLYRIKYQIWSIYFLGFWIYKGFADKK